MPETAVSTSPKLSGIDKAAILLISLGPIDSANVLRLIPEEEANKIARAVVCLERASEEQIRETLVEFDQYAMFQGMQVRGGFEYAQKLLIEAYGLETATKFIDGIRKTLNSDGANFENFRKVDPQQLAKFIQDEHPQTIALILSNLDAAQAAILLNSLPVGTRTDVTMRMADLDQISPEVIRNIADVLDQKLRNLGELSREAVGGVRAVANMFNRLDPNTCSQLLDAVERTNPTLLENIRRFMFVFRDLESLQADALRTLMGKVERNTLLIAMKGANESLRQKFISTQSQRGAEMMSEELANLGPVKLKDVDAAQQQIIAIARELEKEGLLTQSGSESDEYVY